MPPLLPGEGFDPSILDTPYATDVDRSIIEKHRGDLEEFYTNPQGNFVTDTVKHIVTMLEQAKADRINQQRFGIDTDFKKSVAQLQHLTPAITAFIQSGADLSNRDTIKLDRLLSTVDTFTRQVIGDPTLHERYPDLGKLASELDNYAFDAKVGKLAGGYIWGSDAYDEAKGRLSNLEADKQTILEKIRIGRENNETPDDLAPLHAELTKYQTQISLHQQLIRQADIEAGLQTVGIDPADYDSRKLRSVTRVARGMIARKEEIVPGHPLYDEILAGREAVQERIGVLEAKYLEARERGDTGAQEKIGTALQAEGNLLTELNAVLERNVNKQGNVFNQWVGFISRVLVTAGVSQAVSRFGLMEPYRFGTQPALSVMGSSGQMGSVLSSSIGELEAYNYELRQWQFGLGAGALMTGIGLLGSTTKGAGLTGGFFGNAGKILGGSALAVGGTLFGLDALGSESYAVDALRGLGIGKDESEILGQGLAKQFADPSRMIGAFHSAMPGLFAAGAGSNFGYNNTGIASGGTGNAVLDNILGARPELRALGYNQENMGALLSGVSTSLRPDASSLEELSANAAAMEVYGMSPEAAISAMQTAQRYGSRDAWGSLSAAAGAFQQEDGSISNFATNVLVPALLQVTEGMTLRNLARSTEELESEVFTFANLIYQADDTRLGQLAQANPEMLARFATGLQATAMAGLSDPQMLAYQLSLGNSFADIFLGRMSVPQSMMEHQLQAMGMWGKEIGSADEFLSTPGGLFSLLNMSHFFPGLSMQDTFAMMQYVAPGRSIVGEDGSLNFEGMPEDLAERLRVAHESGPGQLAGKMAEQVDRYLEISHALIPQLSAIQDEVIAMMQSPALLDIVEGSLTEQVKEIRRMLEILVGQSGFEVNSEELGAFSEQVHRGLLGDPDVIPSMESILASRDPEVMFAIQEALNSMGPDDNVQDVLSKVATSFFQNDRSSTTGGSFSTGGFTGMGGRHSFAGTVHAGEYVISSDKVASNRSVLDRIQSGENTDESISGGTEVTIRVRSSLSHADIQSLASRTVETYLTRNRLNYT